MTQPAMALRLSLSEIAALTRVKRPVVSMWRSRSRGTSVPFPEPALVHRGQQFFDAVQVTAWLEATGLGNNPQASADMAAFARQDSARIDPELSFASLRALVTLRYLADRNLGGLGLDALLDEADDADPDDDFLYSEIAALGAQAPRHARHADLLVDAAYSPAAAFEQLLADRFRAGLRDHADTSLAAPAIELVARCAVELSAGPGAGHPVFVDPTPGGSDLLTAIARRLPEHADPTFLTCTADAPAARTALCRLLVHGLHRRPLAVSRTGEFTVREAAMHVAAYPPAGAADMAAPDILAAIEHTVLQMDDGQRGLVLAPATVLADALADPRTAVMRSDLLRTGRVRAIVRLPVGLVPAKTRQALALWVLGPAHASVPIAGRWTLVADLSATTLNSASVQELVGDLAVSMESAATIRAHSMRFARLVPTSRLLARRGSLMAGTSTPATADAAGQAVRADQLIAVLNNPAEAPAPLSFTVELGRGAPSAATVQQLLDAGHVKYQKGSRLNPQLPLTDDGGARVFGTPELGCGEAGGRPAGPPASTGSTGRRVNRLVLAGAHPTARLTEPGDVVFTTTPTPAAVVDAEGGAVVEYPARVLRISAADPGGLMAELVAADINAAAAKDWRQWPLRLIAHGTAQALRPVLAQLEQEQAAARLRLGRLNELTTLIRDGVSAGGMVVGTKIEAT